MTTSDIYREEFERLQRQLASPPPGWFTFGSHVDQPGIKLEFWGDDAGVPMWERPILEVGSEREHIIHLLATGLALPRIETEVPVNMCPDDDPFGERPTKKVMAMDLGAIVDHLIAGGVTVKGTD